MKADEIQVDLPMVPVPVVAAEIPKTIVKVQKIEEPKTINFEIETSNMEKDEVDVPTPVAPVLVEAKPKPVAIAVVHAPKKEEKPKDLEIETTTATPELMKEMGVDNGEEEEAAALAVKAAEAHKLALVAAEKAAET